MAEPLIASDDFPPAPDVSHLVTEDDEPLDNFFQDKQADMLVEALRVSWDQGRPFVSAADVGIFSTNRAPALVPDVLLATGVEHLEDPHSKEFRSYFIWNFGKPPEVVIEIVSNDKGGEDTTKLAQYATIKVPYYVIYDPEQLLSARPLRIFQLSGATYVDKVDRFFPEVGLGLTVWPGVFDGMNRKWLRWTDSQGQLLALGQEEKARADQQQERAEALERKLRELGVDPADLS